MLRSFLMMLASLCGLTSLIPTLTPSNPTAPYQVMTPPVLEFVEYQKLDELGDTQNMTISPDGTKVVWPEDTAFCVYEIASEATECISTGDVTLRVMTGFAWSPDSRYLAFYEDVFLRFYESDLWVFNFEAQQLVNLTEDNLREAFLGEGFADLDYLPVWGPENTLYFFRTRYGPDLEPAPFGLYRISLANGLENGGEPELVADLTGAIQGERLSVYSTWADVLDGSVSLSPDGQILAFLVRPSNIEKGQRIWVLYIASGDVRQIAVLSELMHSGIPVWDQGNLYLSGLGWSGDGQYLVVATSSPDYVPLLAQPVYAIHVNTNEVMTLIDFSGVPDEASFIGSSATDQVTGSYDVARTSVVTPDGSYVVYFNQVGSSDVGVSALPLLPPNDSNTPLRLFRFQPYEYTVTSLMLQSTTGDDGEYVRVLMWGYMYTFAKH